MSVKKWTDGKHHWFPLLGRLIKWNPNATMTNVGLDCGGGDPGDEDDAVWTKTLMLLDPYRLLQGDYGQFPTEWLGSHASAVWNKLLNPCNSSYVDMLGTQLLSGLRHPGFPRFYESYVLQAGTATVEIFDVWEELHTTPHFKRLQASGVIEMLSEPPEGWYDDDESEGTVDGPVAQCQFNGVPVGKIVMERMTACLDDTPLSPSELDDCLFQVLSALAVAQERLGYIHNDLHGSNVMWVGEPKRWVVIDSGRAMFNVGKSLVCSDQLDAGEEADNQYNFPGLGAWKSDEPIVGPNPAFDLTRLAVGIHRHYPNHPRLNAWMEDADGKNQYFADGEHIFQDFDLYEAISRKATITPAEELKNEYWMKLF